MQQAAQNISARVSRRVRGRTTTVAATGTVRILLAIASGVALILTLGGAGEPSIVAVGVASLLAGASVGNGWALAIPLAVVFVATVVSPAARSVADWPEAASVAAVAVGAAARRAAIGATRSRRFRPIRLWRSVMRLRPR